MHLGVEWLANPVLLCLTDKGIAIPDCWNHFHQQDMQIEYFQLLIYVRPIKLEPLPVIRE